jgi:hypothetical protein
MKKLILCGVVALTTALSYEYVTANVNTSNDENNTTTAIVKADSLNQPTTVDGYISKIYNQIDFGKNKLDAAVFQKAYHGYLALSDAGQLNNGKHCLTVCDFSKSSTERRLWVIDLDTKKVVINDYVAHGQGSGDEFATAFSNSSNSHESSLGFYVTADTYIGKHGTSLRMRGMDKGFNDAAYDRAVVVHGADYVSEDFIAGQKRLGRSWGCPAVSNAIAGKLINTIKEGTVLFIYAPQKQYLQTAYWLNKKIDRLPGTSSEPVASANTM